MYLHFTTQRRVPFSRLLQTLFGRSILQSSSLLLVDLVILVYTVSVSAFILSLVRLTFLLIQVDFLQYALSEI